MRSLLFFLSLFLFNGLWAQQGTTLEEYRFLSKGYAYQKDLGLDATKDGYRFQSLYTSNTAIEFVGMYRLGQQSPQAILCILDQGTTKPSYLCLPNNAANADILALYQQDRNNLLAYEKRQQLDAALVQLLFYQMGSDKMIAQEKPAPYTQEEVFTARGGQPEPLVATAKSAPSYPVNSTQSSTFPPQPQERNIPASQEAVIPLPNIGSGNSTSAPTGTPQKNNLSLEYNLGDRGIRYQPAIGSNTRKRGKIVVKICVNQSGVVTSSKFTQRGSTTLDSQLIRLAVNNARAIEFEQGAITEQCGTISYTFNL